MKFLTLAALAFSFVFVAVAPSAAQNEEAREEFRAGITAARSDDWEVARSHFERAYELAPRSSVLANLATAQRQTGQLVEAKASYEEWLRDPPSGPLRRQVRAELNELRPLVPTLNVQILGAQPGDVLLIDGREVAADSNVEVNPGWREIEVERGSRTVASLRVNLDEGDHEEVQLTVRGIPNPTETARRTDDERGPGPIRIDPREPRDPNDPDDQGGETGADGDANEHEGGSLAWLWVTLTIVVLGTAAGVTTAVLLGGPEDPFIGNSPPGSAVIR